MVERACPRCGEDGSDLKGSLNKKTVCPECGHAFRYEREKEVSERDAVFRVDYRCTNCGNRWERDFEKRYSVFDHSEHLETGSGRGVEITEPKSDGRKWDVVCPNCGLTEQVQKTDQNPI